MKLDTPPTPFPYEDFQHALDTLKRTLARAPAYTLLSGDSGSGKTTLLRTLSAKLDHRRFQVLYLCHSRLSPSGLNRVLAEALHLPPRRTRAEISRWLTQTLRALPTRLLLCLDEAQQLADDTLHELRLLAEAELDAPPLFSVVLSALPELKERLLAPQLFPLRRRLRTQVSLTGLRRGELERFLAHSLGKEAAALFAAPALDALFEQANGLPALLGVFAEECLSAHPKGPIGLEQLTAVLDRANT